MSDYRFFTIIGLWGENEIDVNLTKCLKKKWLILLNDKSFEQKLKDEKKRDINGEKMRPCERVNETKRYKC